MRWSRTCLPRPLPLAEPDDRRRRTAGALALPPPRHRRRDRRLGVPGDARLQRVARHPAEAREPPVQRRRRVRRCPDRFPELAGRRPRRRRGRGQGRRRVPVRAGPAAGQPAGDAAAARRDRQGRGCRPGPHDHRAVVDDRAGRPAAGGVRRRGPAGRSGRQHRQAADERDRPDHHDQRPGADRADRRAPGRVHGVDAARLPGRHRLEQRRAGRPQARHAPARRADVRRVAARAAEESRGPRVPAPGRVLVRRRARHVRPGPGLALCRGQRVLEPGRHDRRAGHRRARLRAPIGHRRRRLSGAGRETPRAPCRHAGRRPRTCGRQAVACPNA